MSRARPRRCHIRCRHVVAPLAHRGGSGPIVQLELLDDVRSALIYATTARNGSGPLRSSFITVLMLEDTIANVLVPYGVCLGEATVTVYKRVLLANATAPGVFRQMIKFSQIASAVLVERGIGLPVVISADHRDVAWPL